MLDGPLDLGLDVPLSTSSTFGIQCTGSDNGLVRIEALLKGAGPVAIYQSDVADPDVPASFSVMGIYGEAKNDDLEIDVDEAAAFGLDALTTPSADAQALLTHVPAALAIQRAPRTLFRRSSTSPPPLR